MKKNLGRIIGIILFLILFAVQAHAATTGSCLPVVGNYINTDNTIYRITWTCTSDASAGTVPSTYVSPSIMGWVYNVDITVSGTPPTSSGAMTLIASDSGNDVMGGNCTVGTTTSRCVPAKSGWVNGTLTPGFGTDNFGNSKTFTVNAWVWRQK